MPLMNLLLAAFLGYCLGDWRGMLLAIVLALAVMAAPAALPYSARWSNTVRRTLLAVAMPGLACVWVIAVLFIWIGAVGKARLPDLSGARTRLGAVLTALASVRRVVQLIQGFMTPAALPWTLANVLMLLVFAGVLEGITVALYVALLAVPVMLVGLVMLAIDTDEQTSMPDQ